MGSGTTQAVAMRLGRRFIGADINLGAIQTTTKRLLDVAKSLQKIPEGLDNLIIVRGDALEIDEWFDREIDKIYLNFSDPWPKNRHEHRRLTSSVFLKRYDNIFCDMH